MKVYNENKTQILTDYDLANGYLVRDRIKTGEIPEQPAKPAEYKYTDYKTLPNGGRYREQILVKEATPYVPAQPIYEDIQIYIPYKSVEEKQAAYEARVEQLIRERYTLAQEFAILRQQNVKTDEYNAYFEFCEKCKLQAKSEYQL